MGDLLLQQVALRLLGSVRETDTVARFGGDEFVVMLQGLGQDMAAATAQVERVGRKILTQLNQSYLLGQVEHHSTPSVGVALFQGNRQTMDELLKQADLAMYESKAAGRNTLRFFDPAMQALVAARTELESDLRLGLQRQQLVLYYQPVVNEQASVVGVEALVRWQHPQRGMVSPADFIPMAEQTGLILQLGQWVLEVACAQLGEMVWPGRHQGLEHRGQCQRTPVQAPRIRTAGEIIVGHIGGEPRALEAGANREPVAGRHPGRHSENDGIESHWGQFCSGRFRNRVFLPVLPQAIAFEATED